MKKGEKKKLKWQKIREQKANQRAIEAEASKPKPRKKYKPAFKPYTPKVSRHVMTDGMLRAAQLPSNHSSPVHGHLGKSEVQELSPDMLQRELIAQKEIARKRKQVAPICNKGAYQYVGDAPAEIIHTLGRKV